MPYVLAGLLLFALTLRSGPLVQLVFSAFSVGFGAWQIWMRQARMRWTGAMFIAVGLYLASWYQPWWLVSFGVLILVRLTLVAEAGRSMEFRRAARRS
jgi:hypothetical protein